MRKPVQYIKDIQCSEEADLMYQLTIQHTFLNGSAENEIYKENLSSLLIHLNSDERLRPAKPYIIFAVLSRKHGMMLKREHFIPNLKSLFQYQEYNICHDNGKNFNTYKSNLELYDHICRFYMHDSEIDIDFCNFCFANMSSLSEWYYNLCEQDFEMPMSFQHFFRAVLYSVF